MPAAIPLSTHRSPSFDGSKLRTVADSIELLRTLDSEMQAQTAMCLLVVAMAHPEPVPMREIAQRVGLAQSSTSRNVALLGKVSRKGRPGLDLLVAREDVSDRRTKLVSLTSRGERFINQLLKG